MNETINNKKNNVNENLHPGTIIRVVHNRENPFVQLNKQALWDDNLSLKAAGLWARCMSRPDNWKFSMKEFVSKCKEGRRAVDSAMKELIDANYAVRLEFYQQSEDGRFQFKLVEYVFFEFPATEQEKLQQMQNLKNSYRDCGFGNLRGGDIRNEHLLIKNTSDIDSKDISPPIPPHPIPPDPKPADAGAAKAAEERVISPKTPKEKAPVPENTPEIRALAEDMLNALKRFNPEYVPPKNLSSMLLYVDYIIRLDNRSAEKVMEVFNWALADEFWRPNMYKPNPAKYLREKYDQLSMKMIMKPEKKERKFAPSSRDDVALARMKEMRANAIQ